jgi:hypothetical protein
MHGPTNLKEWSAVSLVSYFLQEVGRLILLQIRRFIAARFSGYELF